MSGLWSSSIPTCRKDGCGANVVTIYTETKIEKGAKPGYQQIAAMGLPLEAHQEDIIIVGWEVTEECSRGHKMYFYRFRDGHESQADLIEHNFVFESKAR